MSEGHDCALLIADIDGTILRSDGTIAPIVAHACRVARETGLRISLASARPPSSVLAIGQALGLEGPHVCLDGSLVVDHTGSTLFESMIPAERVRAVLAALTRIGGMGINVYRGFEWTVPQMTDGIAKEIAAVEFAPTVTPLRDLGCRNAHKLSAICTESDVVHAVMKRLRSRPGLRISSSKPTYVEITAASASKGVAVRWLIGHLGFDPSRTASVGDASNDVPMFEATRYGYAMGNGNAECRDAADAVVPTNDEDGIVQVLRLITPTS
jgi:Cof subfamily protein (haloacid dehalogenase superfamily)